MCVSGRKSEFIFHAETSGFAGEREDNRILEEKRKMRNPYAIGFVSDARWGWNFDLFADFLW